MTQPSESDGRKAIGGDLIIPGAALAFTLYYFSTIIDSPWTAQVAALLVGSVLIVLIAIFAVVSLLRVSRGEASLGLGELGTPRLLLPKRLGLLLLTMAYIALIDWGGFTLTTFVFLAAAMLLLNDGRRRRLAVLLAAGMALGGYLLFVVAFDTRFPDGPFERLMEGMF